MAGCVGHEFRGSCEPSLTMDSLCPEWRIPHPTLYAPAWSVTAWACNVFRCQPPARSTYCSMQLPGKQLSRPLNPHDQRSRFVSGLIRTGPRYKRRTYVRYLIWKKSWRIEQSKQRIHVCINSIVIILSERLTGFICNCRTAQDGK